MQGCPHYWREAFRLHEAVSLHLQTAVGFLPAPHEATGRMKSKCVKYQGAFHGDGDAGPSSTLDFIAKTHTTKTDTYQGPNAICTAQVSPLMHRQKHAAQMESTMAQYNRDYRPRLLIISSH